jgi:sigma-B regulation protein RsbU (phosphoserine phosphatase)
MIAAPIPKDDAGRLAELHALGLLDTPPEERFDRIIRLISLALKVPIAFISLVDADRQWFKAGCGLGTPETPRSISFCGHAILSDEATVVPDAAEDERFFDNPLVTGEPHIRFYAGHPLRGPGGHKVGTLCIADRRPRTLQGDDLEMLGEVARVVERELGLVEAVHLQRELIASQRLLLHEMAQASKYVLSLLPEPTDGGVRTRWRFEPSSDLGGDFFGYGWIDPDHFAVYLLDVSGHGVGAALLSVSVGNVLRGRSLPGTDFRDPSAVLSGLNDAFPMDSHDEKYFTIWYGVFHRSGRKLTYASGGHPPALLLTGPSPETRLPVELGEGGPAVGMFPGVSFDSGSVPLGPSAKLYVFSDGVYEIHKPDGSMMKHGELVDYLASSPESYDPDEVWRHILRAGGPEGLVDDFSLLEVLFG